MIRWCVPLVSVLLLLLAPWPGQAQAPAGATTKSKQARVFVMDIRAEEGVSAGTVRMLDEVLLTALQSTRSDWQVLGKGDLGGMFGLEETKVLAGCSSDSCLAEIGGAMDIDRMVAGSLGKVGSSYLVTLKLINAKQAKVDNRVVRQIPAQDDLLVSGVRDAVRELVGTAAGTGQGSATIPSPPPPDKSTAHRARSWPWPWVAAGVAVLGAGAGAVGMWQASRYGDDARSAKTGAAWDSAKQSGDRMDALRTGGFVTAGLAAVAAVVLWVLAPEDRAEPAPAVAGAGGEGR